MTVQMNYLAIIEEITVCGHLIRMAIISKFILYLYIMSNKFFKFLKIMYLKKTSPSHVSLYLHI